MCSSNVKPLSFTLLPVSELSIYLQPCSVQFSNMDRGRLVSIHILCEQLRSGRVQHRFLSFETFLLKSKRPPRDYIFIHYTLNISTLAVRRDSADPMFITSLPNGTIGAPEVLATV